MQKNNFDIKYLDSRASKQLFFSSKVTLADGDLLENEALDATIDTVMSLTSLLLDQFKFFLLAYPQKQMHWVLQIAHGTELVSTRVQELCVNKMAGFKNDYRLISLNDCTLLSCYFGSEFPIPIPKIKLLKDL